MKKKLCAALAAMWVLLTCVPAAQAKKTTDYVVENCYNYADLNRDEYATSDVYYNYDDFVDTVQESDAGAFLMGSMSFLTDISYKPDVDDYMQALSTVLALADTQNGSDPAVQESFDHLKDPESYIGDLADLCMDTMSYYTGAYGTELEDQVSQIAEFVVNTTDTSTQMLESVFHLQDQLEDFVAYDQMLSYVEQHSDGELKEAAQIMRKEIEKIMQYNLDQTMQTMAEGVWETEESIFNCIDEDLYEWMEDQELEDGLKMLQNLSDLKDAFDLGKEGALLAGNLILDTENSADRVSEMVALDEIAQVMTATVDQLQAEFLDAYEKGEADRNMARNYMDMVHHLYDVRRRGEYCLYSTIRDDSGLLSKLFHTDEVDEWYRKLTDFLDHRQWQLEMNRVDPETMAIHYYRVFDGVASTWEEAAAYCEAMGGHLATIGSQAENDHVYAVMRESGYSSAYIGLTDRGSEGHWSWVNGEPVIYMNWHRGEPSNSYDVGEHYAMFYYQYQGSSWNDGYFNGPTARGGTAFICEWDVDPDTFDTDSLGPKQ